MAPVQFNEYQNRISQGEPKGITKIFIDLGLAKDEQSANVVMVIFSVICIGISIYLVI